MALRGYCGVSSSTPLSRLFIDISLLTFRGGHLCLMQERISEIEARRDLALGDFAAAATAVDAGSRLDVPELDVLWQRGVSVGKAVSAAELAASSPYWQECGGGGSAGV